MSGAYPHSAPMETHVFGLRLPANASDGQKRFPISLRGRSRRKVGLETNHRPIDSARNSARVLAKARAFEPNKTPQHRTSAMSETSFLNNVPIPTSTGKENRYNVDRKDRS